MSAESKRALTLCAAATPGPWEIVREELDSDYSQEQEHAFPQSIGPIAHWEPVNIYETEQVEADARFIAEARTLLPQLAEQIAELEAALSSERRHTQDIIEEARRKLDAAEVPR